MDIKSNEWVRHNLDDLIRKSDTDYASVSVLLNRNKAYIQQFIKRGSPQSLSEKDRKTLSRYFNVDESFLGAPEASTNSGPIYGFMRLKHVSDISQPQLPFPTQIFLLGHDYAPQSLYYSIAHDNSMAPIIEKDDVVVVLEQADKPIMDGLYIWHTSQKPVIRRITHHVQFEGFKISCDNPLHPDEADNSDLAIMPFGQVIWIGKNIT